MKSFFLILFFLNLLSCQTPKGYFITEMPLQVPDVRIAVNAVIGKPRLVSENGRELYSEYHDAKFQPVDTITIDQPRYYTKVGILGPRRPYDIQVEVFHEIYDLERKKIVIEGVDDNLSRQRAIKIKKALNISLEKDRGIDVTKPF